MKTKNELILDERTQLFNKKSGARVGDFLKLSNDKYIRFSHDWGNDIQTTQGGSFYLGKGYAEFSGGLAGAIDKNLMQQLDEMKQGAFWFFNDNQARAHNGHDVTVECRVFEFIDKQIEQEYINNNKYSLGVA